MSIQHGDWSLDLIDGALRTVCWRGVEVLRGLDCPIRDENWGTYSPENVTESWHERDGKRTYSRRFTIAEGAVNVALTATLDPAGALDARLTLRPKHDFVTNRAGFSVLHPIAGVAGTPLTVRHSDGHTEQTQFPALISPGQPAFDIAGLTHERAGIRIELALGGEVFEMEDQRNWSDASYKTYCRPLSKPWPYTLAAGDEAVQTVQLKVSGQAQPLAADPPSPASGTSPELLLAVENGWAAPTSGIEGLPLLLRLYGHETGTEAWVAAAAKDRAVDLEIVVPADADPAAHLAAVAAGLAAQGITPRHVIALPEPYLKSYQPSGPWPDGPSPADAARAARRAFPQARIGVGVLTNFTELNRCRPEPGTGDYLTFSTTAIVHAADDRSVRETLEALPQILQSAQAIAPGLPIRLGLVSIGMRTNPYGAGVLPNPDGTRLPMAQEDPRQSTPFAAEFAAAAYDIAARAGVEALALASPGGPFAAQNQLLQLIQDLSHPKN